MTKLDSILKSRGITLPTKVHLVKAMVFPVVMYGCESWTTKAERRRINAFELWGWRRLLSPLDCKEIQPVHPKGNQSWIFIGRTDAKAETPIKFGHMTHLKRPWCWESLKTGGEGDDRGWDGWMASPTQWTWVWASPGSWWWMGRPSVLQSMVSQGAGLYWATELTDCSWGPQGKNTEVVCHSLLQWTTFCQNSPPWPVHLGWPYTTWLIVSLS